jgi:DNA-binding MarR family transcriptional regulator
LLEKRGLIVRAADPTDGRRVFVCLSDKALVAMNSLFCAIPVSEALL